MPKLRKMDLIDRFTGLRKSQDKKMEASKEKNGQVHPGISETGLITVRRVSEFNSSITVISTKECGPWIRSMVKAHTGDLTVVSSEENTQAIGLRTRSTAEVHSSSKTQTGTMDTG